MIRHHANDRRKQAQGQQDPAAEINIGYAQQGRTDEVHPEIRQDPPTGCIHLRYDGIVGMRQYEISCQMVGIVEHGRHIDEDERKRKNDCEQARGKKPSPTLAVPIGRPVINDAGGLKNGEAPGVDCF
jgi:hypothetical protein